MSMKIVTIVGARPQFIKAASISRAIIKHNQSIQFRQSAQIQDHSSITISEVILHTGQHYDDQMSAIFFKELDIPAPDYNLGVGSGSHGWQTGQMLEKIEEVLIREQPDWILVYGDTNSTLAGALAAAKLHIKVAHVEAGLRSFNRMMPEEVNRVVVDHISDMLLCPSRTAVNNLANEGINQGVHIVGDVMADSLAYASERVELHSHVLNRFELLSGKYLLATIHRPENTDHPGRLSEIMDALNSLSETVIFPMHPRTQQMMRGIDCNLLPHVKVIEPQGYLDMVALEKSARMILTDSGGIQKEAYWLSVPCITLRDETEWVETVQAGWNVLTGAKKEKIVQTVGTYIQPDSHPTLYADGHTALRCLSVLIDKFVQFHRGL
jgi:UDP-GlcNAc3NAcA epimerase